MVTGLMVHRSAVSESNIGNSSAPGTLLKYYCTIATINGTSLDSSRILPVYWRNITGRLLEYYWNIANVGILDEYCWNSTGILLEYSRTIDRIVFQFSWNIDGIFIMDGTLLESAFNHTNPLLLLT